MRQSWFWVILLFAFGCGDDRIPTAPTSAPTPAPAAPSPAVPSRDANNWTPFVFPSWEAGLGEPLTAGSSVTSKVIAGDICVANIRTAWDRRASCRRYAVTISSKSRFDLFLRWDPSAPGYDPTLVGDVVLVAPDGRFNSSPSLSPEEHTWAVVEPGVYGVIVNSYVDTDLPFQLRTQLDAPSN
jgi:hypothetical protein